ncbi:MAG: DUF2085 domain-containing protein [Thermoplasmata archaeon]
MKGITSAAVLAGFIITSLWAALVISAPLLVPSGTLTDLSGFVGSHENDEKIADLAPLPKAIYWVGDGECHQIANRSYFLNGNQMPFCARDLGLFLGLAIGFGFLTFYRYKLHPFVALVGFVPLGIDGGAQLLTDYESTNMLRMATGVVAGIAASLLLAHFLFVLQEDREKSGAPLKGKEPPSAGQG